MVACGLPMAERSAQAASPEAPAEDRIAVRCELLAIRAELVSAGERHTQEAVGRVVGISQQAVSLATRKTDPRVGLDVRDRVLARRNLTRDQLRAKHSEAIVRELGLAADVPIAPGSDRSVEPDSGGGAEASVVEQVVDLLVSKDGEDESQAWRVVHRLAFQFPDGLALYREASKQLRDQKRPEKSALGEHVATGTDDPSSGPPRGRRRPRLPEQASRPPPKPKR